MNAVHEDSGNPWQEEKLRSCQLPSSFVLLDFGLAYESLTGLQGEKSFDCLKFMPILPEAMGSLQHLHIPVLITHFLSLSFPWDVHILLFEPVETEVEWEHEFSLSILLFSLSSGAAKSFKVLKKSVSEVLSHILVSWTSWDYCTREVLSI